MTSIPDLAGDAFATVCSQAPFKNAGDLLQAPLESLLIHGVDDVNATRELQKVWG